MKILFMSSAEFALPSLASLLASDHQILGVVTQPDKPAGRGQHVTPCPAAHFAHENHLSLFQPESIKKSDTLDSLKKLDADLIVVVAYGKFLPQALRDLPPRGCINLHSSLLPKYRGAAPINWAIINGEKETGVTIMHVSEEMDAGDIIASCVTDIDPCETAPQLHDRLALLGADLLLDTIEAIEKGTATRTPQHHQHATFAPALTKDDGKVDWSSSAKTLYNRFRGMMPWPGTYTHMDGKILHLHEVAPRKSAHDTRPGTVLDTDKKLVVATGDGELYILEVQLEGKKRMPVTDFLRGHTIKKGSLFS